MEAECSIEKSVKLYQTIRIQITDDGSVRIHGPQKRKSSTRLCFAFTKNWPHIVHFQAEILWPVARSVTQRWTNLPEQSIYTVNNSE
jgi:hypothetical protein